MAKSKGKDLSALMGKAETQGSKTTKTTKTTAKSLLHKTTIALDEEDKAELDRIQDALKEQGVRTKSDTQIIRIALRIAFQSHKKADLVALCDDLAEKWRRGPEKKG